MFCFRSGSVQQLSWTETCSLHICMLCSEMRISDVEFMPTCFWIGQGTLHLTSSSCLSCMYVVQMFPALPSYTIGTGSGMMIMKVEKGLDYDLIYHTVLSAVIKHHQGDILNMEVEKESSCLSTIYSISIYCQKKDIWLHVVWYSISIPL